MAVKVFLVSDQAGQYLRGDLQRFRRERDIMSLLTQHGVPHVVQLLCDGQLQYQGRSLHCLVMEMKQRSLYSALRAGQGLAYNPQAIPRWPLALPSIKQVVKQLLQALSAIADTETLQHVLVHRDIKCSNVLLDAAGNAFLIDWGVSSCQPLSAASPTPLMHTRVGTPYHTSPAIISGPYSPAVDIWSLGVCVVEMLAVTSSNQDLRGVVGRWSWEPGGQERWANWLQRFACGEATPIGWVGHRDSGPASLRHFVGVCCSSWTGPMKQKLDELSNHLWLKDDS